MNARIALLATALVSLAVPAASGRAASTGQLPLRLVADVPLPGGSSRFDYQSLDASRNRLYISHLAAGAAVVFDVKRRRVSATIAGLPGVHGVLVAPSIRRMRPICLLSIRKRLRWSMRSSTTIYHRSSKKQPRIRSC